MTQRDRRLFLIDKLIGEQPKYRSLRIPEDEIGQKELLRSLFNVRFPKPVSEEFLRIQDEYLSGVIKENGIVTLSDISPVHEGIYLWQGDITRLAADAIVNAANSQMLGCFVPMHTCIDNCIHTFAGVQLRSECSCQMDILREKYGSNYEQPTAVPMLTDAYNLPAKKVIHIVGPIVSDRLTPLAEKQLSDCYRNTLEMCVQNNLKSVAFCCISTGVFRFPNDRAAEIAVWTVLDYRRNTESEIEVIFNVWKDVDYELYGKLLG